MNIVTVQPQYHWEPWLALRRDGLWGLTYSVLSFTGLLVSGSSPSYMQPIPLRQPDSGPAAKANPCCQLSCIINTNAHILPIHKCQFLKHAFLCPAGKIWQVNVYYTKIYIKCICCNFLNHCIPLVHMSSDTFTWINMHFLIHLHG